MANRAHSAAYYFYMARRVRGAYATDCERQSWYQLFVDAAGVAACVAPSNEEFRALWEEHSGHPEDFAAAVLERWGGWPEGVLGTGGTAGVGGNGHQTFRPEPPMPPKDRP